MIKNTVVTDLVNAMGLTLEWISQHKKQEKSLIMEA